MASVLDIIKHYQQAIEKYSEDEGKVLRCISKLFDLRVTVQHLQETGVGRTVNALRKEPGEVGQAARTLVLKWKMMVAAEESDQEGDPKNDTSSHNGQGSGRDSDDHSQQSRSSHDRYNSTKVSTPKLDHKSQHKDVNGHHSGSKRKYHSSEEENSDVKKKSRRPSSSEDNHKKQVKTEELSDSESSDDDSESSDSDSDSYSSKSSQEDVQVKKEIKKEIKESPDRHRSSSKHSQSNNDVQKRESTSSRKPESDQHSRHKSSSKDVPRQSSESSSKSSSYKHKSSHEKENKTEKKHKSDISSDEKKESKSSSKHSSDKHKSSSHSSSDRNKSSSDKYSSKEHKKSSQTEKAPEKHKSSSEKETSTRKSRESSSSSKEKHSSSSKEKSKDKSGSSKERSSHSHSSDKRHSSSDSKSHNSNKSKHKSDDGREKKSKEKSSSSSSHKSKSKEDVPKKKSKLSNSEESGEDGIDCGSGASFAEALGMISPTKGKKKSQIKDTNSPNNSYNNDLTPAALLAPSAKLAPLPLLEISALPEISPNYKPRPPPKLLPHFSDEDAISAGISSKNQRTKVYSGNKVIGKMTSLYEICVHVLQENIDGLEYTGGVPYEILKPVVDRATPQQLFNLENYNPYLMEDTDHLWQKFCERSFRNKKRQEFESWREMFIRCQEEQEHRLKSLTANIRMTQEAKKAPIKQTKMAYVDSIVKPPRNIARKQAQHGTAHAATASPAARVASLSTTSGVLKTGALRPPPAASVSASSFNKPKKAPLMQKALQFMRRKR